MIETLISAGVTLLICMINNYYQQMQHKAQLQQQREEAEEQRKLQLKEAKDQHDETIKLVLWRLEQLEVKQDRYNNVIQRTYELEKSEEILETKLKATNDEVKRLAHFHE